ncbi:MAG: 4Fe-4S dicluster domain-containing protein [Muribaculaceae bacterium]|nr:4Fe-4S dicluster domain-containing protein [Muribaculaceae bacterium]
MYRSVRTTRIIISLIAMGVPTWALVAGYNSVLVRMQILTALMTGVGMVLVFWAAVTLIYGRIYCSTVCPMGTLMDCVSFGSRLIRRSGRAYSFRQPSRRTRIVFLLLTFVSLLSSSAIVPTLLDPYSAYSRMVSEFFGRTTPVEDRSVDFAIASMSTAIATALVVVGVAWKNGRLLCNTICPVGTILGYGARRAYFHIEIDPDRCISCGECERVCKAQCIKVTDRAVDNSRCVVCFDCTAACPNGSISYKSGHYRLGMPMLRKLDTSSPSLDTSAPGSSCEEQISSDK